MQNANIPPAPKLRRAGKNQNDNGKMSKFYHFTLSFFILIFQF